MHPKRVENLNAINGRDIQRFKKWRSEQVTVVTLKSQMDTLRVFLRFCESINGVVDDLADSVRSPSLERVDVRDKDIVREGKATDILAYHDKYHHATVEHTLPISLGKPVFEWAPPTVSILMTRTCARNTLSWSIARRREQR